MQTSNFSKSVLQFLVVQIFNLLHTMTILDAFHVYKFNKFLLFSANVEMWNAS